MISKKSLIGFSVVALVFSFYFEKYIQNQNLYLSNFDFDSLSQFLSLYSIILVTVLILCIFLDESSYKKWWRFARIYLPIAFILILISGDGGGGLFVGGFGGGFDREGMIWFTSGLFAILSLFVIARSWWKSRLNSKE